VQEGQVPADDAKTILLVGATGRLGMKVVNALRRSGMREPSPERFVVDVLVLFTTGDKLRILVREKSLKKLSTLAAEPCEWGVA
jgi:uncharacterized protein YbjT (DUF2867 family)